MLESLNYNFYDECVVVRLYKGVDMKENFVELIQQLVSEHSYSSACKLATALELFNFGMESFVLPLILQ